MTPKDIITAMQGNFDPKAAGSTRCTIQFNTSSPNHLVIADGACRMVEGAAASPDVTLIMTDEDFVAMMTGRLNGLMAFMSGKLQILGDMGLAQRFSTFFKPPTAA